MNSQFQASVALSRYVLDSRGIDFNVDITYKRLRHKSRHITYSYTLVINLERIDNRGCQQQIE